MKYLRLAFGLLFLFSVTWLLYYYFFNQVILVRNFDKAIKIYGINKTVPAIISGLSLILGIFFGSTYNRLKDKTGKISWRNEIKKTITGADFFRSLIASPILFAGIYVAAGTQPDLVVAFLLAFQNGFFCNSILNKKEKEYA